MDPAGLAIWASVSDEVDARIQGQVRAGVFPMRLKPKDWSSGETHWLLDVVAPDARSTAALVASLRQLVPDGRFKLHPAILRLLDDETLQSWRRGAPEDLMTEATAGATSRG